VTRHGGLALSCMVVVHRQGLVCTRRGRELPAAIQAHFDERAVVGSRALERPAKNQLNTRLACEWLPGVLPVGHRVDANVPILTRRQHVLTTGVNLHVVERGLSHHVVDDGEFRQTPPVLAHFAEYDGFVGAAGDHLNLLLLMLLLLQEAHGRNGGGVVVKRGNEVVVATGVEDVDEAVARGRGQQTVRIK